MIRVIVTAIHDQHILDDGEFAWIKGHLNQPLRIASMLFDQETDDIFAITVRTDSACGAVITLFVGFEGCDIEYKLVGGLPIRSYRQRTKFLCLCCGAEVPISSAGWASCPNCLVAVKVPTDHLKTTMEEVN